jgi:hypothetical protein
MRGTVKIALVGALLYVAFFFLLKLAAIGLARYKGSVGIDLSRADVVHLEFVSMDICFFGCLLDIKHDTTLRRCGLVHRPGRNCQLHV